MTPTAPTDIRYRIKVKSFDLTKARICKFLFIMLYRIMKYLLKS